MKALLKALYLPLFFALLIAEVVVGVIDPGGAAQIVLSVLVGLLILAFLVETIRALRRGR
ncbi:hypothetical protein [Spirillospora sp. CA-294931]|uniref:hypothetical protein n=1 Tax=Spirillospora sp. CA-294931 TaxID=3240042 RepID=UPI003D9489EF